MDQDKSRDHGSGYTEITDQDLQIIDQDKSGDHGSGSMEIMD